MRTHKTTSLGQLPAPHPDALAVSQQVVQTIRRHINGFGHIPFSQFMSLALYTPQWGYYANSLVKFGRGGDFVTAPEISPLFGACVARQIAELLLRLDGERVVLELGAGSGALASSVLLALADMDVLPTGYWILETSAYLRHQQETHLKSVLPAEIFERVVWLDTLPKSFQGVCLANEVMDALPVEVLRFFPDDAQQGFVRWDETHQRFDWDWQVIADGAWQKQANQMRQSIGMVSERGYTTEFCPALPAWIASLAECMTAGGMLLIDYGYARQEYLSSARWMGTLRAHYQQRAHQNVFWHPGLQDLTAHVDFTAVAEAGTSAGLTLAGYTTQAHFLLSLGIVDMVDVRADVLTHLKISQQIKTLTMPDEMGEVFKVMAFVKGIEGALSGFAMRDLRVAL